jgi:predicted metal-dependent hydrolase
MSELIVRKLEIDLSQGFSRHWLGGDAYRTALFNALSMSFPIGEQMFIDSLRAIPADQIADPLLAADIRDFIGQEASHRFVHEQYNAHLVHQGFTYIRGPVLAKRIAKVSTLPVFVRVAITCALEHYTAMLADGVLRHGHWLAGAEPHMRTLWEWHAAEETEHKAVAFDAYQAIRGKAFDSYLPRVLTFLHVSIMFWFDTFIQTTHNLHRDGTLWRAATWRSALATWFGRSGLAWHFLKPSLAYLRPSFHPWQHANAKLAEQWLAHNDASVRPVSTTAPTTGSYALDMTKDAAVMS